MEKKELAIGYAAFNEDGSKALHVNFDGFSAKTTLTEDPEKIRIEDNLSQLKIYAGWYNRQHKNKIDFKFMKVKKYFVYEVLVEEAK